jgi:hypothetical protein
MHGVDTLKEVSACAKGMTHRERSALQRWWRPVCRTSARPLALIAQGEETGKWTLEFGSRTHALRGVVAMPVAG